MNVDDFYQSRQDSWKALSGLVDKANRGIEQMTPDEIARLGKLYRAATSDLAIAQRDFPHHRVALYLNQLVGRAHGVVYRGEPLALRRLVTYATEGFPRIFRETLPFTLTAAALFFATALIAGLATSSNPQNSRWLLPQAVQDLIPQMEQKNLWTHIPVEERPYASSAIMTNNIRVAMLAFGGGILAGVATVWVMVYNGLVLGGTVGLTFYYGLGFDLLTFMVGHGVIELSVAMISGGAGLMMGWSILRPGLLRRRDALVIAARRSVTLLAGCVPLLVVAGTIEGFISPAEVIPWPVKWGIGLVTGVLLYSYLLLAGREPKQPRFM